MAIEFREVSVHFDSTKGIKQREPFAANFSRRIRTAQACLKGYNIGYTDGDHHIFKIEVDIDGPIVDNNIARGHVDYLFRDSSGRIDDRYNGWIQLVVMADLY